VEISNSGMCNRKCVFCPRSDANYPHVNEFLSEKLHSKLCSQLSKYDYDGVFTYAGFNEPLLHKNIYNHVKEARFYLPDARIEIITNGDTLNRDRLERLFNCGLSTISISAYDNAEQANKLNNLCKDLKLSHSQFIVRHRYLAPDENFGIKLTNRGGAMENAKYKINSLNSPINNKCFYPSYEFFLDYNGDILMCCNDWLKKNILGNLKNSDFIEIWTSEKAKASREKLYNGNRGFKPCDVCDAKGTIIGGEHADAWKNISFQKIKNIS
jgi:radical SAM protein with 4Fe4S-binding SPASM domain